MFNCTICMKSSSSEHTLLLYVLYRINTIKGQHFTFEGLYFLLERLCIKMLGVCYGGVLGDVKDQQFNGYERSCSV